MRRAGENRVERSGIGGKNEGVTSPEPKIIVSAKAAGKRRAGGRQRIVDEFMDLNVSRQRKWQLRQSKKGLCIVCSERAVAAARCLKHALDFDAMRRKRKASKRRNNSKLQRLAVAAGLVR